VVLATAIVGEGSLASSGVFLRISFCHSSLPCFWRISTALSQGNPRRTRTKQHSTTCTTSIEVRRRSELKSRFQVILYINNRTEKLARQLPSSVCVPPWEQMPPFECAEEGFDPRHRCQRKRGSAHQIDVPNSWGRTGLANRPICRQILLQPMKLFPRSFVFTCEEQIT
jgi:hypothetical protein